MSAEQPILITTPWAHGTNLPANIVYPTDTPSNVIANQFDGFPPGQEADPTAGGEYVKRAEMNGVFKLYSLLLNYINQGGQFTINPNVITQGGYDIGVILYCASNNTYQRSLMNANTANFVANSSYINDNIHWSTVTPNPDVVDNITTGGVVIGGRISGATQKLNTHSSTDTGTIFSVQTSNASAEMQGVAGDSTTTHIGTYKTVGNNIRMEMSLKNSDTTENTGIITLKNYRPYLTGDLRSNTTQESSIFTLGDHKLKYYTDTVATFTVTTSKLSDGTWAGSISGIMNWTGSAVTEIELHLNMNALVGVQNFIGYNWGSATGTSPGGQRYGYCLAFSGTSDLGLYLAWETPLLLGDVRFSLTFHSTNVT